MSINQYIYNELLQFILETISSEEYLNGIHIHRAKPINNWKNFKKKVEKQSVKPGIYPRSYGRGSVHYYAVRHNMVLTIANGYSSSGGINKKYTAPLNAQPNHSHGLCQTFALMYYVGEEKRIKQGKYFDNVNIGLLFLLDFIKSDYKNREKCWSSNSLLKNIKKLYKTISDRQRVKMYNLLENQYGDICLSHLIVFVVSRQVNLREWFDYDKQ